jgi:hypothetical protein
MSARRIAALPSQPGLSVWDRLIGDTPASDGPIVGLARALSGQIAHATELAASAELGFLGGSAEIRFGGTGSV